MLGPDGETIKQEPLPILNNGIGSSHCQNNGSHEETTSSTHSPNEELSVSKSGENGSDSSNAHITQQDDNSVAQEDDILTDGHPESVDKVVSNDSENTEEEKSTEFSTHVENNVERGEGDSRDVTKCESYDWDGEEEKKTGNTNGVEATPNRRTSRKPTKVRQNLTSQLLNDTGQFLDDADSLQGRKIEDLKSSLLVHFLMCFCFSCTISNL